MRGCGGFHRPCGRGGSVLGVMAREGGRRRWAGMGDGAEEIRLLQAETLFEDDARPTQRRAVVDQTPEHPKLVSRSCWRWRSARRPRANLEKVGRPSSVWSIRREPLNDHPPHTRTHPFSLFSSPWYTSRAGRVINRRSRRWRALPPVPKRPSRSTRPSPLAALGRWPR